jgi:futalosine hydrolase
LIPTREEERRLRAVRPFPPGLGWIVEVGFGPVAAAARAAEVLARLAPRRVLLIGIAGTFDERRLPIGEAARFDRVSIDGIGAGSGSARLGPREVGIPQWSIAEGAAWDELALGGSPVGGSGRLLTVCSASATAEEARERALRFGAPLAEDMEGFGVALACAMQATPLAIVRGISNCAGERDARAWKIDAALEAASRLATELLASDESWPVPRPGAST